VDSTSADPIQQTADGGYVVAGRTESFGVGGFNVWVLKLDGSGNIQWQKTYGGTKNDMARAARQTVDGGYVVVGYTKTIGAGDWDVWVLKLDGSGNPQWQKTYGGEASDLAYSIWETADGGWVVAGGTESHGAGSSDAWVLKLDLNGAVQWQKTYGISSFDEGCAIRPTIDGGYVVAGLTDSVGAGDDDFWLLKLDDAGEIPDCYLMRNSWAATADTAASVTDSQATASDADASVRTLSVDPQNSYLERSTFCEETVSADVTGLWPPGHVSTGGTATLWAEVENTGTLSFPASANVWFFVWGPSAFDWVGPVSVSGLAPGASKWYGYDWALPSGAAPGTYYYWAVAAQQTMLLSPWSGAQGFTVSDAWAAIQGLVPVANAQPGATVQLGAQVSSVGSVSLPGNAYVYFLVYGPNIFEWAGWTSVAGLAPGTSQQFTYGWAVPEEAGTGTSVYWAVVATTDGVYLSDWSAGEFFEIGGPE
jgi:hypothetical protein